MRGGGYSEIFIPLVEYFFQNAQLKDLLRGYIQVKWDEYSAREPYKLKAVLVMADSFVRTQNVTGLTNEQINELRRTARAPSECEDRKDAILFMIHQKTEKRTIYIPYLREGKVVRWAKDWIDLKEALDGRFSELFPHMQNT